MGREAHCQVAINHRRVTCTGLDAFLPVPPYTHAQLSHPDLYSPSWCLTQPGIISLGTIHANGNNDPPTQPQALTNPVSYAHWHKAPHTRRSKRWALRIKENDEVGRGVSTVSSRSVGDHSLKLEGRCNTTADDAMACKRGCCSAYLVSHPRRSGQRDTKHPLAYPCLRRLGRDSTSPA